MSNIRRYVDSIFMHFCFSNPSGAYRENIRRFRTKTKTITSDTDGDVAKLGRQMQGRIFVEIRILRKCCPKKPDAARRFVRCCARLPHRGTNFIVREIPPTINGLRPFPVLLNTVLSKLGAVHTVRDAVEGGDRDRQ
jgi:hypothetical protein